MRIEYLEQKTDALFDQVGALPEDEVKARLSEYLCIRASGLLENVVKALVMEYAEGNGPQEVTKYVQSKLVSLTNLEHEKLKRLLLSFSQEWHDQYVKQITEAQAESLNSIYGLRNSLAHGGSSTVSYARVKSHYENMKGVIGGLKLIIAKKGKAIKKKVSTV